MQQMGRRSTGLSRRSWFSQLGHMALPLPLWLQPSGWGAPTLTGPGRGLSSSGAPLWVASIRHFAAVRISGHVRVSSLMSISPQPK